MTKTLRDDITVILFDARIGHNNNNSNGDIDDDDDDEVCSLKCVALSWSSLNVRLLWHDETICRFCV